MKLVTSIPVLIGIFCPLIFAADSQPPVSVTLDETHTFAFPDKIFGVQDEVFTTPYLTQGHLDGYRNLGISVFRYPCGTPSEWLAWDDIENGYWPSDFEKKRTKMTPDAFVAFCRTMNYTPIITVNTNLAGTHDQRNRINPTRVESIRKGAAYAAKWLEHANVKNKAGVKYWEIGNETWVWLKEDEYPVYVREYAKALRAVDPSISIIACGLTCDAEYNPTWLDFPDDPNWKPRPVNKTGYKKWTRQLLAQAKGSFDYIAPHIYLDGESIDPIKNGVSLFAAIDDGERQLQEQIQFIQEAKSTARLAVTEWMINWHFLPDMKDILLANKSMSREVYNTMGFSNTPLHLFVSVLGAADWFGKMISCGYVDIAVGHTLTTGIGLAWDQESQKSLDPILPKPAGAAMEFWSQCKDHRVVPVRLANVPTYQYKNKSIPLVSAYATTWNNRLNVILINRSPDRSLTVALPESFRGKKPGKVTEHAVEADSWAANLWPAVKDRNLYPFKKTIRPLPAEGFSKYELKPCKLIRLEIEF